MDQNLSVIIPCYNCQETLSEAVESIYRQNLKTPFEVILVDDASTDQTWETIIQLSKIHPEIKTFRHQENLGGGAARNTAVAEASNDLIFCLDSDDLLGEGILEKMRLMLLDKKCDAVGISTSIKFRNRDVKDVAFINYFGYVGEKIPFESLLEKGGKPICPLYSTFMFTKRAFAITGGYPTNHGFDTQGFAWRFLVNGLVAYTCPETVYFHRINFGKSYYIREYESGRLSYNWLKIYEEFLFIFNDKVIKEIIDYDLNNSVILNEYLNKKKEDIFIKNYHNLLTPEIKKMNASKIKQTDKEHLIATDAYWLGVQEYEAKNYLEATKWLTEAISKNLTVPEVYYKLYDSLSRLNNQTFVDINKQIEKRYRFQKQGSQLPFYKRVIRKINRLIKS